jgi:hypothetical protein
VYPVEHAEHEVADVQELQLEGQAKVNIVNIIVS